MGEVAEAKRERTVRELVGIDALRLGAAMAVMVFHLGFKPFALPDGFVAQASGPHLPSSWPLTWWGWIGVEIFFVVSGLVIAFSAVSSGGRALDFAWRRVLRLLPALLIVALFALAVEVSVFGKPASQALGEFVRTITFFPFPPWIMGQFWTIGVELSFYGVVALMIAAGRERMLPGLAWALIGLSTSYWLCRTFVYEDTFGRLTQLILFQHGVFFGIGILIADAARMGWTPRHLAGIAAGTLASLLQVRMSAFWEGGEAGVHAAWPIPYAIFVASILFIMVAIRFNEEIAARIGRSGVRWARIGGLMTYPLYLVHMHAGMPAMILSLRMGMPAWLAVAMGVVASVLLALVVAMVAEPWLRGLMARAGQRVAGLAARRQGASREGRRQVS